MQIRFFVLLSSRFYSFEDIDRAIADSKRGDTIKPVPGIAMEWAICYNI